MSARANCKLIGRWRIVQADIWERDHLDLCGPAMITITGHGRGEIAFGALQAGLDIEYSRSSVGFTWEGFDEMDEVSGDGFAATSPPCSRSWQRSTKSPPIAMRARPDALAPSEPPEPEPPAKSSSSSWLPSLHPLKSWSLQQTRRGSDWSMAPVVEAFQAMRGASFLVAVTFAAEVTVARRFDTPRQLMSFLGLVPTERSTGDTVRRKGLTLAGNRRALVEAGLDLSLSGASQRCLEPGSKACRSPCATSPGRRRSAFASVTVASGKKLRSSWLRLPARWQRSCHRARGRATIK